jgi:paraquat-inducible protein A
VTLINPITFEACPECDLLLNIAEPKPGDKAHCPRCGYLLQKPHKHSIERTLALSIAGLILMMPANLLPMLGVKILGKSQDGNLWSGVFALFQEDMWAVALLVMLSSVLLPFINMSLALLISLHLFIKKTNHYLMFWMRWYQHLNEWAMIEVYALGIIVAWVKLSDGADLKFGLGLYAFVGLLIINAMLTNELDRYSFWQRIAYLTKKKRP